jgi:hypothetical protein
MAWDTRVDTWLVDTARQFGAYAIVPIATCLLWFLLWTANQVRRGLREATAHARCSNP